MLGEKAVAVREPACTAVRTLNFKLDIPNVHLSLLIFVCLSHIEPCILHISVFTTLALYVPVHTFWSLNTASTYMHCIVCGNMQCALYPLAGAYGIIGLQDSNALEPVFLDMVNCTGEESNLTECIHLGIHVHQCAPHLEDAGVVCQGWTSGSNFLICGACCMCCLHVLSASAKVAFTYKMTQSILLVT